MACFDSAIAQRADYVEAYCSRGNALFDLGRFAQALADYDQTVRLRPDLAALHFNRANALERLGRGHDAIACFRRAIALGPATAFMHYGLGYCLARRGRIGEAMDNFRRAIALKPDYIEALVDMGNALVESGRLEQALTIFDRAMTVRPEHPYLEGARLSARMRLCDWRDFESNCARLLEHVAQGRAACDPFTLLALSSTPQQQLLCAQQYVRDYCPPAAPPPQARAGEGKIRIAYLSGSLRDHPITFLMSDVFALHDRSRFELIALSYWPPDGSAARAKVESGFDAFHDVSQMDDNDVAALAHKLRIDIAVDLDGFSQGSRMGVMARRVAPIQVTYLGYPGTLGADYIDYVIADRVVLPPQDEIYCAEKIVYLPGCYQANSKRLADAAAPTRSDCGLPETGLVFCCFNNPYKITPDIFSVWMRLLAVVEGSVLWLLDLNPTAKANLQREAAQRGIDPARLVFAPHWPHGRHLARIALADLFLDTLYYNAHTTASDALWAGVPVLTCPGGTFASRVGASLLTALGLEEVIVRTLTDYEAAALALARQPQALAALRARVKAQQGMAALFDPRCIAGQLDRAFAAMWQRRATPPAGFSVEP